MTRSQVPSRPRPWTRLARSRVELFGVFLVAGFAFASGQTADTARVTIASAVDANWRGAYDILVRPAGSQLDLERTNGLVEPNFLGFAGAGGISLDQLARIRAIPNVALAAPVSVVGYLRGTATAMAMYRRPPPTAPTLYEIEMTLRTSDGQSSIVLDRQSADVLLGPDADLANLATVGLAGLSSGQYPDGSHEIDGTFAPAFAIQTPLLGVDPVAERALLGPTAGFLDVFGRLADRDHLTVDTFDTSLIPPSYAALKLLEFDGNTFDRDRPVVPVIVSSHLYAPLTVDLHAIQIGRSLDAYPPSGGTPSQRIAQARAVAGPGQTDLGTVSRNVTADLRPFLPPDLTVDWPGSTGHEPGGDVSTPTDYSSILVGRPTYQTASEPRDGVVTFSLEPTGVVGADGTFASLGTPAASDLVAKVGTEPAFRPATAARLAVDNGFTRSNPYDRPFHFGPIGEFDLGALALPTNPLNYVPLGAYDPPDTVLVRGPDGAALSSPIPLAPTLQPAGLIQVPPLAVTDLAGAELLRGPAPIDAVRIRVAGVTGYDPASRTIVEAVASAISALGLSVDIVAGSSPQPVEISVKGYRLNLTPPGDLGTVRQGWTTLGAAERVEAGLSATNLALLGLALASGIVFVIGLGMMQLTTRRREAALLSTIGWTRLEILRWLTAEAVVAGGVIAVIAILGWLAGGRNPIGLATGLAFATLLPLVNGLLAFGVLRRLSHITNEAGDAWLDAPRLPRLARGVVGYGVRTTIMRPIRSITVICGLALGAAALSIGLLAVVDTGRRVGPTLLAGALGQLLSPYQLGLLILTAVAGIGLTSVLMAVDLRDRADELRILEATGWRPASIRRAHLVGRLSVALAAGVVGAAIAASASSAILPGYPAATAFIAAGVALSVLVWGSPRLWGRSGA